MVVLTQIDKNDSNLVGNPPSGKVFLLYHTDGAIYTRNSTGDFLLWSEPFNYLVSSGVLVESTLTPQDIFNDTQNYNVGTYKITITGAVNHNQGTNDVYVTATFDGANLDDTTNEIARLEPKDSTGTHGTSGSSQKYTVARQFVVDVTTAGNKTLLVQFGTDANGINSGAWGFVATIERIL